MDRFESRALEKLLKAQQLLECIDEQRQRCVSLKMLSSLTDIAIEKGFFTMEQLETAMDELQSTASQIDIGGIGGDQDEESARDGILAEIHRGDRQVPAGDADSKDFLTALTEQDHADAEGGDENLLREPGGAEEKALESTMQKSLLAELAYPGDTDSQVFEVAITEVDGQSLVGKTMLGYQLSSLIGEGPISDVFKVVKAGQDKALSLKIFPKRIFRSPLHIKRFLTRTRRATKLEHANILRPLECGETRRHVCYVLTEFIEAVPLWLLIKRHNRISEQMSLAILRFIARGLEYAHNNGFVHGNLKPANVLVTPRGIVKITDWGTPRTCLLLAWDKLDQKVSRLRLISEGISYLSPEIVLGETEVDVSCDVYSLGAIFYHMVTGKLPFRGEREEILKAITKGFPELPADLVSPGSQALLQRLCAKDPKERYSRLNETVADIETTLKSLRSPSK